MATNQADRDLAQRIDAARVDSGLTVLELANQAQIPLTTLQRRLAGDDQLKVSELRRISLALNVPTSSWEASA